MEPIISNFKGYIPAPVPKALRGGRPSFEKLMTAVQNKGSRSWKAVAERH